MSSDSSETSNAPGAQNMAAALVTRDERLALALGPARHWEASPGYSLAPLALPSMIAGADAGRKEAMALAARVLGLDLEPVSSPWTYGPSARHMIDREPASASDAPFLRYERYDAPEDVSGHSRALPRRVTIAVYLARARGAGTPAEVDVIWLPLRVLRAALSGLWLSALLAMDSVSLMPAVSASSPISPENTLVFTPAGSGERLILRACAKYGDAILFTPRLSGSS